MLDRHLLVLVASVIVACGPPGLTGVGDETSSSDPSSGGPSTAADDPTGDDPTGEDPTGTDPDPTGEPSETETGDWTSFVPEFDVTGQLCDQWAQDCPEGEKCVPFASSGDTWDSVKCVPITGDQAPGEPCEYGGAVAATDDCDASSMCWFVEELDGVLVGSCAPFCTGTEDDPMCPEGYSCLLSGSGVIALCVSRCDPLLQDCQAGEGCYWTGGEFSCVSVTEDIEPGQPCGYVNDCAPGNLCVDGQALPACADAACCAPFCELGLGDGLCESVVPGTSCVPFFPENEAPPGYEAVGVCVVP